MIAVGEAIPEAIVFAAPGEEVSLAALAQDRPALFVFYLLDWSGT